MPRILFLLLGQFLSCILLMQLGWGFDDVSQFFSNPARVGLVAVALIGALASAVLGFELHPLRKGTSAIGKQFLEIGVLWLLSLFLLWFLPFADRRRLLTIKDDYWRYVGLLLCCIAVGTRLLAMKALGGYFSAYVTLQSNHRLVQKGIYSHIRHPLYLSLLLAPAGIALVFSSILALPILLLASVFVFDRIRKEERLLAVYFGAEFDDYERRTWSLFPLLF
jgi:protein-S-isoprenylcysteine O-methyltransferase Ste14